MAVAQWAAIATSVTGDAFYDSPLVRWRVADSRILTGLAQLPRASRMPAVVSPEKVLEREGFLT